MVSKAAIKILEGMRRSKGGWRRKDFDTVYLGFGFIITPGRSHDIVKHPDFPQLRDTLPRHAKELGKVYVSRTIELIDRLNKLKGEIEASDE